MPAPHRCSFARSAPSQRPVSSPAAVIVNIIISNVIHLKEKKKHAKIPNPELVGDVSQSGYPDARFGRLEVPSGGKFAIIVPFFFYLIP